MSTSTTTYRWNVRQAAADYDAAGPVIHPCYNEVQQAVVAALPFTSGDTPHIVDLGGGSGRLAERVLEAFPASSVTVIDPSGAFLQLASERLRRFGQRARLLVRRAQEGWEGLVGRPNAIISTSALHHLDGSEKNAVFAKCHAALAESGIFINGDEYRPPSDIAYRSLLEQWGEHMESAVAIGTIPDTFREVVAKWRRRNLDDFGGPRESGDDCHETVEEQTARLYGAGFKQVETAWKDRLWVVLVSHTTTW